MTRTTSTFLSTVVFLTGLLVSEAMVSLIVLAV